MKKVTIIAAIAFMFSLFTISIYGDGDIESDLGPLPKPDRTYATGFNAGKKTVYAKKDAYMQANPCAGWGWKIEYVSIGGYDVPVSTWTWKAAEFTLSFVNNTDVRSLISYYQGRSHLSDYDRGFADGYHIHTYVEDREMSPLPCPGH